MKSKKRLLLGIILLLIVISISSFLIIKENTFRAQVVEELKTVEVQKQIWENVVHLCDQWTNGEITREDVALKGNELLKEYKEIEGDTYNNSTEVLSDSNSIKLETQVMLFDMVRGFELEGNEYSSKEKIKEETLKYVYPKRAKTFQHLYDNFIEKYK